MDLGTRLTIFLRGRLVGSDAAGNRYYLVVNRAAEAASSPPLVAYAGEKDDSEVPAEWHAWLHYTTDTPLPETGRQARRSRIFRTPRAPRPAIARRDTTTAAVIAPQRMAIMSLGHLAANGGRS